MSDRPYTILSVALSLDWYRDDSGPSPLLLSSVEDLDAVDAIRASCDAILVGAKTIRRDNPSLTIKSEARIKDRLARGIPADVVKVILSSTGHLDPASRIFDASSERVIVYCRRERIDCLPRFTHGNVEVRSYSGRRMDPSVLLSDLHKAGVRRLLVEGGEDVHSGFVRSGLFDELRIAIAPFIVGASTAPRFLQPGQYGFDPRHPLLLVQIEHVGPMAVLTYQPPSG